MTKPEDETQIGRKNVADQMPQRQIPDCPHFALHPAARIGY